MSPGVKFRERYKDNIVTSQ